MFLSQKRKICAAKLVQVTVDPFSHYIMLDKGKNEGILENQAIIDTQGVVGSVNSVNRLPVVKFASLPIKLMLCLCKIVVMDFVVSYRVRVRRDALVLLHAPLSADYQVGDPLLTSGLGGRFPVGYPVGTVSQVEHLKGQAFARITVKPMADFSKMNHVLVVTDKLVDVQSLDWKKMASSPAAGSISNTSNTQALELIPPERSPSIP